MNRTHKRLSIAAVATMVAIGGPGVMALASPSDTSTADITVTDCVVESSKDISYIEYLSDGEALAKDETVDTTTYDLSQADGIEDADAIAVKAGTTVEEFTLTGCTTEDVPTGGSGEVDPEEPADEPTDEGDIEDTVIRGAGATITLTDCVVESSKDISYIEYQADGDALNKDESINTETYDLSQVDGIDDVDTIAVKSSTTVEEFALTGCTDSTTTPDDTTTGTTGDVDDATTEHSDTGHSDTDDSTADKDAEPASAHGQATAQEQRTQSNGHNGHGEGDERHDGRHEKWGGQPDGTEEQETEEQETEETEESEDTEETESQDSGDTADDDEDEDDES